MKKLRVGMIGGGGPQNFFGGVHRRALHLDGTRELVAGALRRTKEGSLAAAADLGITGYADYTELLNSGEDLDYVVITTTNDAHFAPAKACLEKGIPVLCEKPITLTVKEAEELALLVKKSKVPFVLAHTYTGHPMLMLAREMVKNGDLGEVRKIESWYNQGWLAQDIEKDGAKQAEWRVDPKRAGISCCGGDIGTHAHMAARWVTGLEVKEVSARLNTFVKGRKLDDDFNTVCEMTNGATALITATQVAIGYKNDNGLKIYGTKGSLEWHQERSGCLTVKSGREDKVYWIGAGYDYFPASIKPYLRLPAGHFEDFLEALANLHLTMEFTVRKAKGENNIPEAYPHPSAADGLAGMKFIAAAVKSSVKKGARVKISN